MRPLTKKNRVENTTAARRGASRAALAALFMSMGVLHFVFPAPFVKVMPPFLPAPGLLVAVSGVFEFLGGLGVFLPFVRRFAGYGLMALLLAVWPANFNMAYQQWQAHGWTPYTFLLLLRLPLQIPMLWWVHSATKTGQ